MSRAVRAILCSRHSYFVLLAWSLAALAPAGLYGQQAHQAGLATSHTNKLTAQQQQILDRARAILKKTTLSAAEQEVRLQVVKATLIGTVIRPDDDYPEMRNPKYWTLSNDTFVVVPGRSPVEAIADLWIVHDNDGVPVPRIRCYKYSTLILIEGYVQYFRETSNTAGLAAIDQLIGHREIPHGIPNGGEELLWRRRLGGDNLLPGDQVWFDNPFYDRGQELIREEYYQQALREGKSQQDAATWADATTKALIAGEEGSNVFCLGDDKFIRCGSSLLRLSRDSFQPRGKAGMSAHEQVLTPKIFGLARFQEHMIDDNYTPQACMRAAPGSVRPEDFKIERVRSPMGPDVLVRLYLNSAQNRPLDRLIDAMASHNRPPRLVAAGDGTIPLFDRDYDWAEQQRVRAAIDVVMRTKTDDLWWRLREKVGDNRYVFTAKRDGVARNFTLGTLCSDIVDARLCLGFTGHLPSVPGRLPDTFRPEQEYWQHEAQWASQRMPLYAMQASLCERAIQQWESVEGTLPGSDGQSHIYTADEKSRYVASLKKEIAERRQTKKAAYEEVIVPWLPAPSGWDGFDAESAKEARDEHLRRSSAQSD